MLEKLKTTLVGFGKVTGLLIRFMTARVGMVGEFVK